MATIPRPVWCKGTDGNFYGTNNDTVFKVTPSGKLTTLYSFCSKGGDPCPDGESPEAGLVEGTDGNFYGTTEYGGINGTTGDNCERGCGTIFQVTPEGQLTTLHDFCSQGGDECTDGLEPVAGLIQDTNGTFYGTASAGGTDYVGVVFSMSMGLGPFVETEPTFGKVGEAVKILGTNLSSATSVTFNGTPAAFTIISRTLITTTAPAGATTGRVEVTGPPGTLSSNVVFRVLP
jgi:uncharacterized repeat protein (TIGR03803 family)